MTLKQQKIRFPTRFNLDSSELEGQEVSEEIAEQLFKQLDGRGDIFKLTGDISELQGYYKYEQESGALFLKVLPGIYLSQQRAANRFAVFVKNAGVQTSTIIAGYPKHITDDLAIVAYEWIEGRCLEQTPLELEQFGSQLAFLHKVLHSYPNQGEVKAKTDERMVVLNRVVKKIIDLKNISSPYLQHLSSVLKNKTGLFGPFSEPCQVLHGDLNVGNLRWNGSEVVFLDFEDAIHSWFPPRIDIAFALERLVLINESDEDRAFENSLAMLRGYAANSERMPFSYTGALKESLEWLNTRSMCMLQGMEWEGVKLPESEWHKFDTLFKHLERRSKMLFEIEANFLGRR